MTPAMLEDLDLFWRVRLWNDYSARSEDRQSAVLPFIVRWVHGGAAVAGSRVLQRCQSIMELQSATVVVAFPAEWSMPFGEADCGMAHIGFTAPYNMSGQPAATVNCGFTASTMPTAHRRGQPLPAFIR